MKHATGIAPAILHQHPELDTGQLELISHVDGPTLGVAGPGAGKTLTVALRGANILISGHALPEELALCTYNRAAARELRQRFITLATAAGCPGDLFRVRVGTIHSLCHSILKPHARRMGLTPDYRPLNEQQQRELMLESYSHIFGGYRQELERRGWRRPHAAVNNARKYFDRIADELVDPRDLTDGDSAFLAALGHCYLRYRRMLRERNAVDFAHLQVWTDELLDDDRVADRVASGIRYLMCDEYQDTAYVQERILMRLAQGHGNLCVVGDEDQSLYRFRGASVQNILEFPQRFPDCHAVVLTINYRSHPGIVHAYDRWMRLADWSNPDPEGPSFRYDKVITPHTPGGCGDYPAVIAVAGSGPEDEGRQLAELFRFLKGREVISGYDQVALLLHSVRDEVAGPYLDALDDARIPARCVPAGARTGRRRSGPGVIVTTIHQAKGLEWPVVVVGSLDFDNRDVDPVGWSLRSYCRRPLFEPARRLAEFDHMRQHYVAFSRPRDLLALTASGPVHPRFAAIWDGLPRWNEMDPRRWAASGFRRRRPLTVPKRRWRRGSSRS